MAAQTKRRFQTDAVGASIRTIVRALMTPLLTWNSLAGSRPGSTVSLLTLPAVQPPATTMPRRHSPLVAGLLVLLSLVVALGGAFLTLYQQLQREYAAQQALRTQIALMSEEAAQRQAELRALIELKETTDADQEARLARLAGALDAQISEAEALQRTLIGERERKLELARKLEEQRNLSAHLQQEGATLAAQNDEQRRQIEERDAHLAHLNEQADAMQRRISEMEGLAARVRELLGISIASGPAGGNEPAAMPVEAQAGELEARLATLTDRSASVTADLASLERTVRQRLVAFQRVTRVNPQVRLTAEAMLAAPAGWPVDGPITSVFGMRQSPFDGTPRFHGGVDIAAPFGTPVRATADGRVIQAGPNGAYGLSVTIRHAAGFETLTGHHSQILVQPGQTVKRGQVVALEGSTGASTGPHVHYEVHYNGQSIDPEPFLALPAN